MCIRDSYCIQLIAAVDWLGENRVQRLFQTAAWGEPVGRYIFITVWNPDIIQCGLVKLAAKVFRNFAATLCMGNPVITHVFVWMR